MKNIILRRGGGKTTRLLAMSEFRNAPIVCATENNKRYIMDMAHHYGYTIPQPVAAHDLLHERERGRRYSEYLIDESQDVVSILVSDLTRGSVIGMTTTDERRAPA